MFEMAEDFGRTWVEMLKWPACLALFAGSSALGGRQLFRSDTEFTEEHREHRGERRFWFRLRCAFWIWFWMYSFIVIPFVFGAGGRRAWKGGSTRSLLFLREFGPPVIGNRTASIPPHPAFWAPEAKLFGLSVRLSVMKILLLE